MEDERNSPGRSKAAGKPGHGVEDEELRGLYHGVKNDETLCLTCSTQCDLT